MPLLRALLLISVLAAPLSAQRWSDLIPAGERVRVRTHTENEEFEGTFRPSPSDTLNLFIAPRDRYSEPIAMAFPNSRVKTVDVSQGLSLMVRGAAGLVVGAVVGGVIGAVFGNSTACPPPNGSVTQKGCYATSTENSEAVAIYATAGAAAGAFVGAIVGAASAPERAP